MQADSLGGVLPILIFVVWVVVSIIASGKKKREAQNPFPRPHRHPSETSSHESTPPVGGDLRRTLENIFGELPDNASERHLEEYDREEYDRDVIEHDTHTHDTHTVETKESLDSVAHSEQLEMQRIYERALQAAEEKKQSIDDSSAYSQTNQYDGMSTDDDLYFLNQDNLRTGIIWSEVLGKPVAMRD
jgi:hypothetical protein